MYVDIGTVRPGQTIFVPFHTFDSNDPSASVTITGLAVTDIEVYKDASMTQRASDSGYALVDTDGIDLDTTTGIHGVTIDLSDNTTAGFWASGSDYVVVIASITVDAATINFIPIRFRIGYDGAALNTTIATLSTQTSFTLTSGPAEDDALNGMWCIIHDVASAVQWGYGIIQDYTGSTKTVTLAAGTTFTAAATDNISIMGLAPLQPTSAGNKLDVTSTGAAGVDWGNVENASTSVDLSATAINLCDTVTTNTDMRGTDSAATAAELAKVPKSDGTATWNATALASINAEADTALSDYDPPTRAELTSDIGTVTALIGTPSDFGSGTSTLAANLEDIADNGTATYDRSTDSLQAIRDRGDAAWTTGAGGTPPQLLQSTTIATLSTQTSFTLTAGSADDDAYNGAIAVVTDQSTSTQKAVGTVSDYTGSTKTVTLSADPAIFTMAVGDTIEIIAALGTGATAAAIRAEIDANSTQLAAIVADTNELQTDDVPGLIAALNDPTAAAIADAVWDEAQSGHVSAGSFGEIATEVASILTDTGTTIPAQITALNNVSSADVNAACDTAISDAALATAAALATVDSNVDAILVDTGTTIPAQITALNNVSVSDVLTTQMTESYAADGVAPTLAQAIFAIQQFLQERSTASTTVTVKKLDGSTTAMTFTLDDATTPTSITRAT